MNVKIVVQRDRIWADEEYEPCYRVFVIPLDQGDRLIPTVLKSQLAYATRGGANNAARAMAADFADVPSVNVELDL